MHKNKLVLILFFLLTCTPHEKILPKSTGGNNEILFVIDDFLWEGEKGRTIKKVFAKELYGIVNKEYKLARFYYDVDEWELYDRLNDPNEMNNVYDDPAYADVVKELKVKLADLRVKYQDSEELDQKFIY